MASTRTPRGTRPRPPSRAERRARARARTPEEKAAERSRRRFARRQWRRRWLAWKPVLAVLLVVAIAAAGIWAVYFSAWLSVQGVAVAGQTTLSAAEIRRTAGVSEGKPLATVDLSAVQARVEALAAVKSADVTRRWPDEVLVQVVERQPVAVVQIGETLRGMDEDGVVFRDYRQAPDDLPRVRTPVGTSSDALREAAEVISSLPTALSGIVDYVEVETVDQISLALRDGRTVVWGSAAESATKAKVLEALLAQPAGTYDVSVPSLPTTKP